MNHIRFIGLKNFPDRLLTLAEVAHRAGVCLALLDEVEHSSNASPEATLNHLSRALDVLEEHGVRFSPSYSRQLGN